MTAREAAFKIINSFDQNKYELDQIIDNTFDGVEMDVRDKRLAFQIVYGVLRNRKYLDYIINQFLNSKLQAENLLVIVLEIAVYQIFYLDRIPAHAAVNEAVNFTKEKSGNLQNFTGVTNAVLRNIIKNKKKAMKIPESMERKERLALLY
jgi:16S rRNA (cytosine967-C5)-methyltransferase